MNRLFITFLFLLIAGACHSQMDTIPLASKDSLTLPDTSQFSSSFRKNFSLRWHMQPHSPLKATIFSALIPGTGQMYNGYKKEVSVFRQYWKVPVVYAGIGTCVAFISYNTRQYHFYKKEFIAYVDNDPGTTPTISADITQLNKVQDQYHRWMDVSYISLLGVYVLQIIDANVDAHLFYYDIGKDLTLDMHPTILNNCGAWKAGIGVNIRF